MIPTVNSLNEWSREIAGNRISQDPQLKKASLTNPTLEFQLKLKRGVTALAFSPDNKLLATADDDYTIRLWDAKTGRAELSLNDPDNGLRSPGLFPDGQKVYSLSFSPDGNTLVSAGDIIKDDSLAGSRVTLWKIPSGRLLRTIVVNRDSNTSTNSVTFSPDGKSLVTGMEDRVNGRGKISRWNARTGALVRKWYLGVPGIHSVIFSPDGQFLVAGCSDATIRFLDASTGDLRRKLHGEIDRVFSLSFTPDGETLASCVGPRPLGAIVGPVRHPDPSLAVHLLDLKTGQSKMMATDHRSFVTSVAFSPDGQHLASGDRGSYSSSSNGFENGTVNIWRISPPQ